MDGKENEFNSAFGGPNTKKRKRSDKIDPNSDDTEGLEDGFLEDPFGTSELEDFSPTQHYNLSFPRESSFDPFEDDLFNETEVGLNPPSFAQNHQDFRVPPIHNPQPMMNSRIPVTVMENPSNGKNSTVFCLFGEDEEEGSQLYNFKPRLKVRVEGLKNEEGIIWVKKGNVIKITAEVIGYSGIQSINNLLSKLQLTLVGSGLPQTYMSKKPYIVFQCLVNVGKKEDGLIITKTPSGVDVMEICKKEVLNDKLVVSAKLHVGTNVSGHWRYTVGYRLGFIFQNVFYVSRPFKVLSRKPSKKKQENVVKIKVKEKAPLFNLLQRNSRFLCFLYIQDSKHNRCVVEFPEVDKPNWISVNNRQKLGQITLSSSGFVIGSNESNYEGGLILNNQSVRIYDNVNNNINVICTIGNSTTIKIVNKPRWAVVFKSKNQIVQVYFPSNSIMIGRTSQFIPVQDLSNEEKARISKLHLKVETNLVNDHDVLTLTDCSKNGSKVMLPLNKAIFEEGMKYEIRFRQKNNPEHDGFRFTFFYSTQSLTDDDTIEVVRETDSFQKRTKDIIKELMNLKI